MANDELTLDEIRAEKARRQMVEHFWKFFKAFPPSANYAYGQHTLDVIMRLDQAVKDYERGISTNLVVTLPYRHGKSDIVSRRLPVWALGRNPDLEVILTCYNDELANDLSRKARACFRENAWIFGLAVSGESSAVGHWEIDSHPGSMSATGIGGSIVGRGAGFLIVDDFLKSREEAESQRIRDKQWESYNDDLRTRLAPVHVNVICATRWHVDDIVGRALNRCDPEHKDYDPEAPKFEELRFPMQDENGEWLFPQRFPESWYREQKSNLGVYGWASLAQQDPQTRVGNLLHAELVEFLSDEDFYKMAAGAKWARGWDIASSKKELVKSDPDWSVGTKASHYHGNLLIDDVVAGQYTGAKRDKLIVATAEDDGQNCVVNVEAVGGYKDAYEGIKTLLSDKAVVRSYQPVVDKVARASKYESHFELGKVYARKAHWNKEWVRQLCAFPNAAHDDMVDSLDVALHEMIKRTGGLGMSL